MKRILLFLATNLAVLVVLGVVTRLLGLDRFLGAYGLNLPALLGFAAVIGFGGAFISLAMSKTIAKFSTGAQVIEQPRDQAEVWLLDTVSRLAANAGIGMPEVAIYEGEPNAFATGARRDHALVAVSTGLLQTMSREQAAAVLGHEISHVANGDMVTLTLIQGVVNTFVVFLSRVVGFLVDSALRRGDAEERGPGMGYFVTTLVCDILFGVLASMIVAWFSRQREFRADAGSARLLGNPQPMISALRRLGEMQPGGLPRNLATAGITDRPAWMELFASHPPLEQRIAALQGLRA
ncbi:MAG: protease HtpX [Betaproteobacteria bacterium]|jgi:heat shock protein HtpX|nr:protease HtpX [Betaproteobacteria bacterium]MBU6513465.1 protease HtpX [Betaproteobacteria bacterium]MDE1955882.1 protease HtpX [Betaproteobacteria bacterium]MDE2153782.1 protease HtpX [Betaproteobacteria bacterium]MDE2478844.1 protease HtpX [Betaproteobacteria bacterium]